MHGEEVNARVTQLNIADGQEGGGGAVLPSHAMLSLVIVTRRTQAGAKETVTGRRKGNFHRQAQRKLSRAP